MGVDVVTIDFRALVGRTGAVLDVLADLCGVARFEPVDRAPVNVAVQARSRWLSAAGKLAAVVLRGAGCRQLLQRLKDSPRVMGIFFRPGGAAGDWLPLGATAGDLLARRFAACRRALDGVVRTARGRSLARPLGAAAGGDPAVTASRPPVSIVIPARNEEALLPAALASALAQDYRGTIEIVVADGSDTRAMAATVAARFPAVRVIPNADRTTPAGLNRAVRAASHAVIAAL